MCTISSSGTDYSLSRNINFKMLNVQQFKETFQDIDAVDVTSSIMMKDINEMEALVSNLSITINNSKSRERTRRKDNKKGGGGEGSGDRMGITRVRIIGPVTVVGASASRCVKRKVQFKDTDMVEVIEFEDDDESKQNRKLYWEFFAVDRYRFKDLVRRTEQALGSIFSPQHRQKIYRERILPYLQEDQEMYHHYVQRSLTPTSCLTCPVASSPSSTTSTLSSTFTLEAPGELSKSQKKRRRRNRNKQKKNRHSSFSPTLQPSISE